MALHPQNHVATIIMDTPWVTPSKAVLGNLNIVHCPLSKISMEPNTILHYMKEE